MSEVESMASQEPIESEEGGISSLSIDANPHAAIIARHQARKAERDKAQREEDELESQARAQQEAKVNRRESLLKQQLELQLKHAELLSIKPLEPKGGELARHEGTLKGWKSRYVYIEDKLPLVLKVYKQYRTDSELLEEVELTSETLLDDDGRLMWGGGGGETTDEAKKGSKSNRPNTITITVKDKSLKLAADTVDLKLEWLDHLFELLNKHHSLGQSIQASFPPPLSLSSHPTLFPPLLLPVSAIVPTPLASPLIQPGSPGGRLRRKSSTDSAKGTLVKDKSKSRNSLSISEEPDEIIDPLEDEFVGQSFKNDLFGV